MKIIGITGGVGCGKSTVLHLIKKHANAYIIMADDVAKSLYTSGSSLVNDIADEFGAACINSDGSVNKTALADIIFSDENKRKKLNAMVHPEVKRIILETIDKLKLINTYDLVLIEAALFFEEEYDKFCDEVWYVTAKISVRRDRLKSDRGYSDEKIDSILKAQLPENEFMKKCDKVIDNSGSLYDTETYLVKMLEL